MLGLEPELKPAGNSQTRLENSKPDEIRHEVKPVTDFVASLESLDFSAAVGHLREISETFKMSYDWAFKISGTQRFGICLTLFANCIFHMVSRSERSVRTASSTAALECILRMSIKMDKKSPINTVSQHSKIFDAAFVNSKAPMQIHAGKELLKKEFDI